MKAIIGYALVIAFATALFGFIVKPAAKVKANAIEAQISERQKVLDEL